MPVNKEIAREKLILAGERLIAEQGIDALSLRQVNKAAGQKNTSAALYHFGNKEGLLLAIFDYRMAHVDARRHALLDRNSESVRACLEAWILPDVEEITEAEGGCYHKRFLAVVCNHPALNLDALWKRPNGSSYVRTAKCLRALLPDISDQLFSMRFGMAMMQSIYSMADQERLSAMTGKDRGNASALFVSHLIDVMEAIFTAPVSAETQRELSTGTSQALA